MAAILPGHVTRGIGKTPRAEGAAGTHPRALLSARRGFPQPGEFSRVAQFRQRPNRLDVAVTQHHDAVRGREQRPAGAAHHAHGARTRQPPYVTEVLLLGCGIEGAARVVQNDQRRVVEERAGRR